MSSAYFLTGTDTDVGKTFVACALLHAWRDAGYRVAGFKPVAAGAELREGVLRNEDALRLHAASSPGFSLEQINPICFADPVSPHIAAARANLPVSIAQLVDSATRLASETDRLLVEGAGGFRAPLSAQEDFADLAVAMGYPVLLVVGVRLGCLNHALLTAEAIAARGLKLAGWIANIVDPEMRALAENIDTLRSRIEAPCIGVVPRLPEPRSAASCLKLNELDA